MLVTSIPTNMTFTGNQTLINLQVSRSVDIRPREVNVDTITTETKFCRQREGGSACKEIRNIFYQYTESHKSAVKIENKIKINKN